MYELLSEDKIDYLIIKGKKIAVQNIKYKDEFLNSSIFITNSESDQYKINYFDLAEVEINKLPDKLVILINISEIDSLENTNLRYLPYPFNEWIVFIKNEGIFSVNYISNIQDEVKGYKNWNYDFFYNQLLSVNNDGKVSARVLDSDGAIFGQGTCIIKISTEGSVNIEESIIETLAGLENILIRAESSMSGLSNVHTVLSIWNENKQNSSEEFWQRFLVDNSWIISQAFSLPLILFQDKVYLGGKGIHNSKGQVIDFVFKNSFTNNLTLIEIKTPKTKIISGKYRNNVFSISSELSGAISQLLNYKDKCQKDYYSLCHNTKEYYSLYNPKCILIVGSIETLSKEEKTCFELFRNELKSIEILTFDEVFKKVDHLLKLSIVESVYQRTNKDKS